MKKSNGKAIAFLKRNAIYITLSFCILAIGLAVTLMLVTRDDGLILESSAPIQQPSVPTSPDTNVNEEQTPVVSVVTFIMPVSTATSMGEYSELPVWNETLDRYSSHMAIDFFAPEGTSVLAVYDGCIESIETTLLQGTTITIDHGNGLKTVYNSILDGENVTVGQKVSQGDVIGEVSTANRQECADGPHLHFSVEENGEIINPAKYLILDQK